MEPVLRPHPTHMKTWQCLVNLYWLTGDDGRVSFSKLVLVALMWMLGILLWRLVDSPNLVDALWPLVWLFALLLAGSYGLKGLSLWFNAAKLRTEGVSVNQRLVVENRDPVEGIDPSP